MKFVLFETPDISARYGLLTANGVVPLETVPAEETVEDQLQHLIDTFDAFQPRLAQRTTASPIPLERVHLRPPVPWPGKILVTTATYGARTQPPHQLLATLKSAESVIGPDQIVHLPHVDPAAWQFVPQAMLGLVIRGPAKDIPANRWQTAVFGYTCVIDVMARGDQQFGRDFWLAKADTLGPLGPCVVTLDEIPDPAQLRVRSWQNGALAQDFLLSDASHSVAEQVAFATTVMTLHSGDILACGTSPIGPRPLADDDRVEVEIDRIGRLAVRVAAPVALRA